MPPGSTQFLDLIEGRRKGPHMNLARSMLAILAIPYRMVIAVRNAWYAWMPLSRRRVGCPVISIGNITVGGTGKTPVAAKIARMLTDRGRRVAILTRGYKGATIQFDADQRDEATRRWRQESDEAMILKRRCPRAQVIVDPNRVAGAQRALAQRANALIMDDGFQHRRLARDLDIALVDATAPFGHGRMLPRGLLREPPTSLRRADLIVLTRSDQVEQSSKLALVGRLKRLSGGKPVIEAVHRTDRFMDIKGRPVDIDDPGAMQAVIFAGIANFASFRRSVESQGVTVLAAYEYPDHHDYTAEELEGLRDTAGQIEANAILTTEKDAVKLVGRWEDANCRLLVLDLEIEFDDDGGQLLAEAIAAVLDAG